jgi:hypothetical protein
MAVRVYVSGPLNGSGEREANVVRALRAADALVRMGFAPYVPHLCAYWDRVTPREEAEWLNLDLCWVEACHALLRLPGHSPGADREVGHALMLGIPVFRDIPTLAAAYGRHPD